MSSIAIVSFIPGVSSSDSGSASIGFSSAWRIAPFTSLMPGSESGGYTTRDPSGNRCSRNPSPWCTSSGGVRSSTSNTNPGLGIGCSSPR